jgi:pyruvate carboxylase
VWPSLAAAFVRGEVDTLDRPARRLGGPKPVQEMMGASAGAGWYRIQMARTAAGAGPALGLAPVAAALDYTMRDAAQAIVARRARMRLAATVAGLRAQAASAHAAVRAEVPSSR